MKINGIDTADIAKLNNINIANVTKFNGVRLTQTPSFPIVTNGLQLYLDASNPDSYPGTGTTWYDLSPSAYNFTNDGGTFTTSDGIKFFSLDGVNDRMYGGSNTSLFDNDSDGWTWSMWVNHSGAPQTLDVLVNPSYTSDKVSYYLDNRNSSNSNGNGFTVGSYKGNPNSFDVKATYNITVTTNVWRHICGTFEITSTTAGVLKMYTNGVLRTTSNVSIVSPRVWSDANTSRKPYIGAFYNEATAAYSRYNAIRVGEVLQYSRPLTGTEVTINYDNTKANYGL